MHQINDVPDECRRRTEPVKDANCAIKAFRKLPDCLGQDALVAAMILNDPKPQAENDLEIASFLTKQA